MKKNQFARPFGENHVAVQHGNFQVGIVDLEDTSEQREYVLFPTTNGIAQMIAVKAPRNAREGKRFAIQMRNMSSNRMAYAIYVNGIGITGGEENLDNVFMPDSYHSHHGKILLNSYQTVRHDHALLGNGTTPALCFVQPQMGFAQYSPDYNPKNEHQIVVFAWIEKPAPVYRQTMRDGGDGLESTGATRGDTTKGVGVGFGAETNTNYNTARGLENPQFLGKTVFVYWPEDAFRQQGYDIFTVGRYDRIPRHQDVDGTSNLGNLIPPADKYPRVIG